MLNFRARSQRRATDARPLPSPTQCDGARGEELAERWLCARGLDTLARNVRCRFGELDLVMRHHDTLVIVEVRQRRSATVVSALESVGPRKQQRIVLATRWLLATRRQWANLPVRFDVVAVDGPTATAKITWAKDAFRAG